MAISAIFGVPFALAVPAQAASESTGDGLSASDPASDAVPATEQVTMSTTVFPFRFDKPGTECVVLPGDTLSTIAHRYLVAGGWQEIHHRNIEMISDPDSIYPGQRLILR
ncbi:MAG: LysM peptidoglycan-binding domain-containing protein [Pseudonocardiaceae bacterium]